MSTDFPTAPLAFRYTERAAAPWKSLSLRLTHKNSGLSNLEWVNRHGG